MVENEAGGCGAAMEMFPAVQRKRTIKKAKNY